MDVALDRRVVPWLLSVPLMLGGTEVAHWLAFRLVYPDPWTRAQVLQQSGHGYLGWLPTVGGIGLALVACAAFLRARAARGAASVVIGGEAKLWQFAALPLLAFTLQEHLEALFSQGTIAGVTLEPTFLLGLSLQLPFAVLAYVVARLLLGAAGRVGRAFRAEVPPAARVAGRLVRSWFALELSPFRVPPLAGGHAERGPPR